LTPEADTLAVSVPLFLAEAQFRAVMAPAATVRVSVQDWPPMLSAKEAVPEPAGVPEMV
jgi:hypothetical protein